ncbi:MAG: signal peptidase I [Clostridia bacterium]|nr:signal peptidase I [Clostridia bacterium]
MARSGGRAVWEVLQTVIVAFLLAVLLRTFVVESFVVRGSSMYPTLVDGERLLVAKFTYRFTEPRRGDIIVFRSPLNPQEDFIKRVIGLPGETVSIQGGAVYIDGKPLDEPYIRRHDAGSLRPVTVPPGHLFVLGDNRVNSEDSRYFGAIRQEQVKGKALIVWWPPVEAGVLP